MEVRRECYERDDRSIKGRKKGRNVMWGRVSCCEHKGADGQACVARVGKGLSLAMSLEQLLCVLSVE